MSVETEEDLRGLAAAGRVVADALRAMAGSVCPGVSMAEGALSAHVEQTIVVRHGAPLVLTA